MTTIRRLLRSKSGTAAVEFALIAPTLFLFLLGIAEFSRAMWVQADLEFACEETARYGFATGASTTVLAAYAKTKLTAAPPANVVFGATVTASSVQITASYPFAFVAANLLPFGPITLSAASSFQH